MEALKVLAGIGVAGLAVYAVRSYGYQKEVKGYMHGVETVIKAAAENDGKIFKDDAQTK